MSVEADYVYSRGRDEKFIQENVNISYTNASGIGINNPYTQPRRCCRTRSSGSWR